MTALLEVLWFIGSGAVMHKLSSSRTMTAWHALVDCHWCDVLDQTNLWAFDVADYLWAPHIADAR